MKQIIKKIQIKLIKLQFIIFLQFQRLSIQLILSNPFLALYNALLTTMRPDQDLLQQRLQQSRQHFTHPNFYFQPLTITGTSIIDQFLMSWALTLFFAFAFYFFTSFLSYLIFYQVWDRKFTPHIRNLREYQEQIREDIKWSIINIIAETPLVAALKMAYPYYSKVEYSWNITYLFPIYLILHVMYDQFLTYWAHRLLHHPLIYDKMHYIHHKSKAVTPFSGIAFHPLDAFIQAIPVFTSCFFIPLPLDLIIIHGLITSFWAISIHDNVNLLPFKGFLYAGSHSIHHFPWGQNYNYGKITSICDRLYGTYCDPEGITGYGYENPEGFKATIQRLNKWFEQIVPDNGKYIVQKQSRRLAVRKRKELEAKIIKVT